MNLLYYYWLTSTEGISTRRIFDIIGLFGSIQGAWSGNYEDFCRVKGISSALADRIVDRRNEKKLLKEISEIELKGINIITIDSEEYPENLRNIYDPPLVLYYRGKLNKHPGYIGIVGSRKCTQYGKAASRNISQSLSKYGVCIVSGLARGIDTAAHMGALDENGVTYAVLGCGLDIVYPPENKRLIQDIMRRGAVISEYTPGTKPYPGNFPARNRIISGLSDGILVVEANEKSGALITANFALEQGREVFAVPGSIYCETCKGTNSLIRDGAKIVTDIRDILVELNMDTKEMDECMNVFSEAEKMIVDIISSSPVSIDELFQKASLKVNEINSLLTTMELRGIIKVLPGKYIVRTF